MDKKYTGTYETDSITYFKTVVNGKEVIRKRILLIPVAMPEYKTGKITVKKEKKEVAPKTIFISLFE